jgi:hypothetical protein
MMSGACNSWAEPWKRRLLDISGRASQTPAMAHTYIVFDFGADEEKAQQARHKLEGWKQAFRLDKKLQIKFERSGPAQGAAPSSEHAEIPAKPGKGAKATAKSAAQAANKSATKADGANNGDVKLLVRLYFSGHEKLSEQQWLERIPGDDLLKGASPKIIRQGDEDFPQTVKQFESLE